MSQNPLSATESTKQFRDDFVKEKLEVVDLSDPAQFARMQRFQQQFTEQERGIAGIGSVVKVEQMTIDSWADFAKLAKIIDTKGADAEIDVRFGSRSTPALREEIEEAVSNFALNGNVGFLFDKINEKADEKNFSPIELQAESKDLKVKISRVDDRASKRTSDPDSAPVFDVDELASAMRDVNRTSEPIQGHYLLIDGKDEARAAEAIATALLQVKSEQDIDPATEIKAGSDFRLIVRQPKPNSEEHKVKGEYVGHEFTAEQVLQRTANQSNLVAAAIEHLREKAVAARTELLKERKAEGLVSIQAAEASALEQEALAAQQEARRLREQQVDPSRLEVDSSELGNTEFGALPTAEGVAIRARRNVKSGFRLSLRNNQVVTNEDS